jgi:hypothetical protein
VFTAGRRCATDTGPRFRRAAFFARRVLLAAPTGLPENITLVQLPPYSPELNPIENLWHYLKSHYWSNRVYAGYEALEEAAVSAWQTAVLDPELMKTVCSAPYMKRAESH